MTEQLTLREAIPDDAANLIAFLKKVADESEFIEFESSLRFLTVEEEKIELDRIYNSTQDNIFLAIFEGDIVGFARVAHADDKSSEFGVVVTEEFSGNNIASYLTEDAINWSTDSKDINELTIEVYRDNSVAIHIYEKYGFSVESETEETIFMKRLVK
ncbi:GNAT family N-acetyltransferase [Lactobacillus terrae]|uniref:GNAT family N-acetyltransferase n=1 Tax=Lactobacillus terrae TaxID=2269374 RepID=UPI000C1B6E79|nr:GNAT family N-acetyltransferase [Lactobacillus terrae]